MTAERDRLAALLRDAQPTEWDHGMSDSYALAYADRLIAAGVGFPPDCSESNPELSSKHSYHEAYLLLEVARLSDSLDVERLARALVCVEREKRSESMGVNVGDVEPDALVLWQGYAAAIAAAYREDAGIAERDG